MDIEPIVKDLYDALDGKVDEATIRKEVDTYINTYRIPVDSAKSGILKKLGNTRPANAFTGGQNVTKKIAELEGTEMNVTVVAKMVFVEDHQREGRREDHHLRYSRGRHRNDPVHHMERFRGIREGLRLHVPQRIYEEMARPGPTQHREPRKG